MIPFFDRFIDTRAKRYHLFLFGALCLFAFFLMPYVISGYRLMMLSSYESLYSLLQEPWMQSTYIARVVLDCIALSSLDFLKVLQLLIQNLGALEILVLLTVIIAFPIFEQKKVTTICLLLIVSEVILCTLFVALGLRATSLQGAMVQIQRMGFTIVLLNTIQLLLLGYHIVLRFQYYRKAMSYQCLEIKEHMER